MHKDGPGGQVGIEQPCAADHEKKVEELEQENGDELPEHRQDIGEDLESPDLIQRGGEEALQQGDLLEGVENAVDPVGVFQGKRNA